MESTVVPCSKLPPSTTPKTRAAMVASSAPSVSRSCAGVHTKNAPSPPGLSASCDAARSEVATVDDTEDARRDGGVLRAQRLAQLRRCPHEERALATRAVGILRCRAI